MRRVEQPINRAGDIVSCQHLYISRLNYLDTTNINKKRIKNIFRRYLTCYDEATRIVKYILVDLRRGGGLDK